MNAAMLEEDPPAAKALHDRHVVAHEEDGAALARDLAHLADALALEARVPDGQHLVDEEDLRLQVSRDGEREPHGHSRRVPLHGRVEESRDLGKRDDFVEPAVDLSAAHAEDRRVQVDVLTACQLAMEARSHLEQRADAASDPRPTGGRLRHAREDLQQRRLAGTVAADHADDVASLDVEGDVAQRPE